LSQPVRAQTSAIASGDTEAMAAFYEQWFDSVYAEARRISKRDESFCLDMVQDTMMRVIRSIKPMDNDASLSAWLRAAVRSCCIDRLRRELRQAQREQLRSHATNQTAQGDVEDRVAWLAREMQSLGPETANLLRMRFSLGWTLQRIAAFVGIKPGAVDGRINRTLNALRAKAPEDFDD
jgi:RNA polymerase sigma factor (sigma-70 family)